jgi:hypothetical protein
MAKRRKEANQKKKEEEKKPTRTLQTTTSFLAQLIPEASSCRCLLRTIANRCLHVAMAFDGTSDDCRPLLYKNQPPTPQTCNPSLYSAPPPPLCFPLSFSCCYFRACWPTAQLALLDHDDVAPRSGSTTTLPARLSATPSSSSDAALPRLYLDLAASAPLLASLYPVIGVARSTRRGHLVAKNVFTEVAGPSSPARPVAPSSVSDHARVFLVRYSPNSTSFPSFSGTQR